MSRIIRNLRFYFLEENVAEKEGETTHRIHNISLFFLVILYFILLYGGNVVLTCLIFSETQIKIIITLISMVLSIIIYIGVFTFAIENYKTDKYAILKIVTLLIFSWIIQMVMYFILEENPLSGAMISLESVIHISLYFIPIIGYTSIIHFAKCYSGIDKRADSFAPLPV